MRNYPYRFIDHRSISLERWLRGQIRFMRHLIKQEFRSNDTIVQYFFRDIFWSGIVRIEKVDLEETIVKMSFLNENLMTELTGHSKRRPNVEDFFTNVTFTGVQQFQVDRTLCPKNPGLWVYASEFWRVKSGVKLIIYLDPWESGVSGTISIVFDNVTVEDISRKIKKYRKGKKQVEALPSKRAMSLKKLLKSYIALLKRQRFFKEVD
jgi:hypothetical protein